MQMKIIKMLLDNNDYPLELIFNKMNARLKKIFVQNIKSAITASNSIDNSSNNECRFIVLLYVNPISKFIATNIDRTKAIR